MGGTPGKLQAPDFDHRVIELRTATHWWDDDFRAFRLDYSQSPYIELDPLYALPVALMKSLIRELPNWFSPCELSFETNLHALCRRYQGIGVFHGSPIGYNSFTQPPIQLVSEELFRKLGWDRVCSLDQAYLAIETACKRLDPLTKRLDAFRGWLAINPLFQLELKALQARWGAVVAQLRQIPSYPVQIVAAPKGRRPRNAQDVTDEFIRDFNAFYDRWELQGLATWDLPEPRGANLSGLPWPARVAVPPTAVTIQISPILSLPGNYPLRAIAEQAQHSQMPAHLQAWSQVVKQEHAGDLRFLRFRRMFLLHFYRDTVLASRYAGGFSGHVEALDRAFGRFLDPVDEDSPLGEDSVKKLRLQMAALRRRDP